MEQNKKEVNLSFRLIAINLIEEKLDSEPSIEKKIKLFKFSLNSVHVIDNEKKWVTVSTEVTISPDETDKVMGYIKVESIFEIENFQSFIKKRTGQVKFPDQFLQLLNSISISTLKS